MAYEDHAYHGTKTRRRELRALVRGILGSSHEAAPHVLAALFAARHLSELLELASGGRYKLVTLSHDTVYSLNDAIKATKAREL